ERVGAYVFDVVAGAFCRRVDVVAGTAQGIGQAAVGIRLLGHVLEERDEDTPPGSSRSARDFASAIKSATRVRWLIPSTSTASHRTVAVRFRTGWLDAPGHSTTVNSMEA